MTYRLVAVPRRDSLQAEFEKLAQGLGLRVGALAVQAAGYAYANEHVNWLWKEFKASRGVDTHGNT